MKNYDRYVKYRESMLKRAYNNDDVYSIYKDHLKHIKDSINEKDIDIVNDKELKEVVKQGIEKELIKVFGKFTK